MSLILHDNLAEGVTPTVSNEATGFEGINVNNWLLYDSWKAGVVGTQTLTFDLGSAKAADTFAAYGHNLGTEGCNIKLEYSSDNSTWFDAFTAVSPSDDGVIFQEFTTRTMRYWRLSIGSSTVDSLISVIAFGAATNLPKDMPDGFMPPAWSGKKSTTSVSVTGNFLGRSVQPEPIKANIIQRNVTPAFVRGDWNTFIQHAQVLPFFFSWDETNYPGETIYAWSDRQAEPPEYTDYNLLRVQMSINGLRD